jgi:hypothetical protein
MTLAQKTNLILVIFIVFALVLVIFLVYPLVKNIQKGAGDLIAQRNASAELEIKIQNLKKFQAASENYQSNLEKIDELFISLSEPINFIKFLEEEVRASKLSIDIMPLSSNETKSDFWPSMNFQLGVNGSFPGFLEFFEKLESSPFLIEVINLDASRMTSGEEIMASLLIKVYTK